LGHGSSSSRRWLGTAPAAVLGNAVSASPGDAETVSSGDVVFTPDTGCSEQALTDKTLEKSLAFYLTKNLIFPMVKPASQKN
jgi:hypothetical protein